MRVEDFAELVLQHRPQWLKEYVEQEARKNSNHTGVMQRLKSFLENLKAAPDRRAEVAPGGNEQGELPQRPPGQGKGDGPGGHQPHDPTSPLHRPALGRRLPSQRCGIPSVSFANDPAILEEMRDRAAMYRREENTVLLNPHHSKYVEDLERIYSDAGADAERQALAKRFFDEEYCFTAGKVIIVAWLFKGKAGWDDRQWEESLSMGALTLRLADPDALDEARRRFRQRLNSRKIATLTEG